MAEATGEFKVADWNEEAYADRKAGKLTRAA